MDCLAAGLLGDDALQDAATARFARARATTRPATPKSQLTTASRSRIEAARGPAPGKSPGTRHPLHGDRSSAIGRAVAPSAHAA